MPDYLEANLKKLAELQKEHTRLLAVLVVLITVVLGIGLKDLTINSDIRKEMPTSMPIFRLNDRISDKFGGAETVVISVQLDESVDTKSAVRDIRDPQVIRALMLLDDNLRNEGSITSISSPASFFRGKKTLTDEEIAETLR